MQAEPFFPCLHLYLFTFFPFRHYSFPAFQHISIATPLLELRFTEYSTSGFIYKESFLSRLGDLPSNRTLLHQHFTTITFLQSINLVSEKPITFDYLLPLAKMCLVQLHKSSKSASYVDMADYPVPARIVTTAYSSGSSDEKHQKTHTVDASSRRSSVYIPSTTAVHSSPSSPGYLRAQRRNTMASGGPARASYVSSRGAAYHRCTEKFFYGRDSGEPLLLAAQDMGLGDHSGGERSSLDDLSIRSTSTTEGANGSVIVRY